MAGRTLDAIPQEQSGLRHDQCSPTAMETYRQGLHYRPNGGLTCSAAFRRFSAGGIAAVLGPKRLLWGYNACGQTGRYERGLHASLAGYTNTHTPTVGRGTRLDGERTVLVAEQPPGARMQADRVEIAQQQGQLSIRQTARRFGRRHAMAVWARLGSWPMRAACCGG